MAKHSSHYLGLQGTSPVPLSIAYVTKTEEKEFADDCLVSEIPYEVWLGCLPILPLYTNGK